MGFPTERPRRLRWHPLLRGMTAETRLCKEQLICPYFVCPGRGVRKPITSMPGQFQFSVDTLVEECQATEQSGLPAVLLFGIPETKDAKGTGGYAHDGIVQRAVEAIKERCKNLLVITDVCLCEYTDHGPCGIVSDDPRAGMVDNDATLPLLAAEAVSHAQAGADIVAPSAMMDGQVQALRNALDERDFPHIPIMAYAAKYASSFYGPFREAAESPPAFGDRRAYQMDPANSDEAMREVALDVAEGADVVMVKPALHFLDTSIAPTRSSACRLPPTS